MTRKDRNGRTGTVSYFSKGHAAPILYSVLAESGYLPTEELKTLRKMGSRLQGHPVKDKIPGLEMSTGSLGQASAWHAHSSGRQDGREGLQNILSSGRRRASERPELGSSHVRCPSQTQEAHSFRDRNRLQISGCTSDVMDLEPLADKWRAFGWNVLEIDGHDIGAILEACGKADKADRPTCVILDTVKGKGVSFMENKAEFHGKSCDYDQNECAMREIRERITK